MKNFTVYLFDKNGESRIVKAKMRSAHQAKAAATKQYPGADITHCDEE